MDDPDGKQPPPRESAVGTNGDCSMQASFEAGAASPTRRVPRRNETARLFTSVNGRGAHAGVPREKDRRLRWDQIRRMLKEAGARGPARELTVYGEGAHAAAPSSARVTTAAGGQIFPDVPESPVE